jgi:hypothetical protein
MARIVYGERFFGRVDRAAGLFHVGTLFFHINYVPLWPLQSCLIREDDFGRFDCTGPAVGMQLKSVLVGYLRGWLAGVCCLVAMFGGFLCGMALYPLSMFAAVVASILLGLAMMWAQGYVLDEAPPRPGAHPATVRLVWHLALTGFVLVLGGAQLLAATAVRDMVGPQFAEPLTVLPLVACALLAAALLLSYVYRATLFLTPAGYERALDLAARFGVPRRVVENRYGKRSMEVGV